MKYNYLILQIGRLANLIYEHEIYYTLKEYGVKVITDFTIEVLKVCIVVDGVGLPITSNIISEILDKNKNNVAQVMVRIGDKDILHLLGYSGKALVYRLHPNFKSILKIDYTEINKVFEIVQQEGIEL